MQAISLTCLLFAIIIFADAKAEQDGSLIGVVLATGLGLATALINYMTGRDRLKFDSGTQIKDAKILDQEKDIKCLEAETKRLRGRVNRLAMNLIASQQQKVLPFPNEIGLSMDEDSAIINST